MKRGFTLVEIMAVLSILLIGGSLTFGAFNSSYKFLNKGKELSDIEDSFRNVALDMEKEINDEAVVGYQIENMENYIVSGYQELKAILLIDKCENSILYFKGKKNNSDSEIFEKIVFDKNSINNNNIIVKQSKTIINKINGDIDLENIATNLLEVNFAFKINNNSVRDYSYVMNLNKNDEEKVEITSGTTNENGNNQNQQGPVEPEIPEDYIPETVVGDIAETFAQVASFIVLDQNSYNSRQNLLNIQLKTGTDNSGIKLGNVNYYIQAISTEAMKKNINTSTTINNNLFKETTAMRKAPALETIYKPNGLTINGNDEFSKLTAQNVNGMLTNNQVNVGCVAQVGNQCVMLVNGDLNIRGLSTDNQFVLGRMANGNGQKILIYVTGKVNIDIENPKCELIINNCTLISANQINIKANKIRLVNESGAQTDKLTEFLKKNLLTK